MAALLRLRRVWLFVMVPGALECSICPAAKPSAEPGRALAVHGCSLGTGCAIEESDRRVTYPAEGGGGASHGSCPATSGWYVVLALGVLTGKGGHGLSAAVILSRSRPKAVRPQLKNEPSCPWPVSPQAGSPGGDSDIQKFVPVVWVVQYKPRR